MGYLKLVTITALAALVLSACSPQFKAAEAALETRVDAAVDELISRMCKGPVDLAVRTAERHPALFAVMPEVCPETYGVIRDKMLAQAAAERPLTVEDMVRLRTVLEQ